MESFEKLETIANDIAKAVGENDKETVFNLIKKHGEDLTVALVEYIRIQREAVLQGLNSHERDFLLKAYQNAREATPTLTEVKSEEQLDTAKVLSERGLLTFTSIPSFVLISKRGMLYVEEFLLKKE